MKKIVLLGTSNSLRINGLAKGIKNQKIELINLSLGAGSSLHGICEIHRYRSKIQKSDLIIIEKNIIDTGNCVSGITPINIILENIRILYEEIYLFEKRVVVLILPLWKKNILNSVVEQEHRRLCLKFGFNFIDIHTFFKDNNLIDFYSVLGSHPLQLFMCDLGKKIVSNMEIFNFPKPNISVRKHDFQFIYINNLINLNSQKHYFLQKNSVFEEFVYRVDQNYKNFSFPEYLSGYTIAGIYSWTKPKIAKQGYSTFVFINKNNEKYTKDLPTAVKHFADINSKKLILSQIKYFFSTTKKELPSEETWGMANKKDLFFTNYTDIIGFLLFKEKKIENLEEEYVEQAVDFQKYDFSHLIPQSIFSYKQIIEEYLNSLLKTQSAQINFLQTTLKDNTERLTQMQNLNNVLDRVIKEKNAFIDIKTKQLAIVQNNMREQSIQLNHIQSKLSFQSKYGTAKSRIQNQLSYKLGQAMIVNSKSILGYIRMPFVLSYIKDKHKQEQKIYQEKIKIDPSLKLPSLESYPDYKEALKEKECLTYKLGGALIRANNNWYGGGYIKLLLEIRRLKK